MGFEKNKALFAVIASVMMVCTAAVPLLSADQDVSADTAVSTDTDFTSVEDLLDIIGSMNIKKEMVSSFDIDEDDGIDDAMTEFITDSGLTALIFKLTIPISTENVFDDVKVIDTEITVADGESVYLNDETGKFANLKFEGDGKYIIEKGGSIVLGPMFKLEGNGTIIELKEGSLIKFVDSAKGYEVPSDIDIVLKGKYESYYSIDYGSDKVGWSDLSEIFPTNVTASAYCDIDGSIGIGGITITGASGKDVSLDLRYKYDKETGSVDGEAKLSVAIASVVLTDGKDELQIKDIGIKASGSITNAKGISFELSVGASIVASDEASMTFSVTVSGSATYDKQTKNGSLKANVAFSGSIKTVDIDTSISASCTIEAAKADDIITAKVSASIDDLSIPTVQAKAIKLDFELKGTEEQIKEGDIKDVLSSFYAKADRLAYDGMDTLYFDVSNVSLRLDKTADEPKFIIEVGKADFRVYESTLQTASITGSNITITVGMKDDDEGVTTIEGDSFVMKAMPISSASFSISAKDFKIISDDMKRLVSGSYEIDGSASISGLEIQIQKDAKIKVDTVEIRDSTIWLSVDNEDVDGTFLFYPDSEYECGENSVVVDEDSVGILCVTIDSESQDFLIKPITGFDLKEPEQGLQYTVREDGYGVFTDVPMKGTLVASGELKSYKLTIDGQVSEKQCGSIVQLPEAPVKDGYTFYKWTDGYRTYSAGSYFLMPAKDLTITALWTEKAQKTEADKTITIFGDSDIIAINADDIKDAIKKLEDKTMDSLDIKTGTSKIAFDGTTAKTLADFTESGFSATVKQADKSVLDEAMTYVVGNGALYSIDLTNGTKTVHDLGGTVKVTVVYDLNGEDIGDLKVFYYNDGTTEAVDFSAIDIGDGKAEVTMELTHFSDYVVKAQAEESTSGGDDNGMTAGVIAGIVAAAIIAIAVIAFVAIKRKG